MKDVDGSVATAFVNGRKAEKSRTKKWWKGRERQRKAAKLAVVLCTSMCSCLDFSRISSKLLVDLKTRKCCHQSTTTRVVGAAIARLRADRGSLFTAESTTPTTACRCAPQLLAAPCSQTWTFCPSASSPTSVRPAPGAPPRRRPRRRRLSGCSLCRQRPRARTRRWPPGTPSESPRAAGQAGPAFSRSAPPPTVATALFVSDTRPAETTRAVGTVGTQRKAEKETAVARYVASRVMPVHCY